VNDRAYNEAEYHAEMSAQADDERRSVYVEAFDDSEPLCVEVEGKQVLAHGPAERPICEGCSTRLERDDEEALFDSSWALFYCSPECFGKHGMHVGPADSEHYEDFGADMGIGVSDAYLEGYNLD